MEDRRKFRVWDNKTKEYLNGLLIDDSGQLAYGHSNGLSLANIEDRTIEQCTGLSDKNGKLIYEGDIIRKTAEKISACTGLEYGNVSFDKTVEWKNGYAWLFDEPEGMYYKDLEFEITGNIHEQKKGS